MNEDALVAGMRNLFPQSKLNVGIGDDAAVIGDLVLTTDLLVEDHDFRRGTDLGHLARKAVAVNLSDLAAMGATPEALLIALGLPAWVDEHLDSMLAGFNLIAREYEIDIAGGDLSRAASLTIAITATGRAARPLLRSAARPGQRIYVSRPIGGANVALTLLERYGWDRDWQSDPPPGLSYAERELASGAIRRFLLPAPEVSLGIGLAAIPEVTSAIDISDGFAADLHRLCRASGVGASIEKQRIPVLPDLAALAPGLRLEAAGSVLYGGDEYALVFTSSLRESELSQRLKRPVYAVGRVTSDPGVLLDGVALPDRGFDHFER